MGIEIERKYVVVGEFKSLAKSESHITQGYICSQKGRTVRVRIRNGTGFLTIKGPAQYGYMGRYEFEQEISLDEAKRLMELCEPGIIDKTRYLVEYKGYTFEVDEFYGENAGLVIAEIELSHMHEMVELPPFIGAEVTEDKRFYNGFLRRYPYCIWKNEFNTQVTNG